MVKQKISYWRSIRPEKVECPSYEKLKGTRGGR